VRVLDQKFVMGGYGGRAGRGGSTSRQESKEDSIVIVQDMRERSGNSQTGVRACFNTKHQAQFSKIFSNIAVLMCFLSTIQPRLGTMEELKYGAKNSVLSEYEKPRRNFQQGEIFVANVDPTKFSYYLATNNYGKTDGSSAQERYKAVMDLLSMPLSPAVLSKYEVITVNALERARNTEVFSDWAAKTVGADKPLSDAKWQELLNLRRTVAALEKKWPKTAVPSTSAAAASRTVCYVGGKEGHRKDSFPEAKKPSSPAPARSSVKMQSVKMGSFVKLAQSDLDVKLEKAAELAVSELVKQGWKQQP
jgi:hypothetical protein